MNVVRRTLARLVCALAVASLAAAGTTLDLAAQKADTRTRAAAPQKLDEEYTRLIKEYTVDPRISTELVDHMPLSTTVPSPLAFLKRIPGTPDELTYAKDIHHYYEALDKASDRVAMWKIGTSEEGRDIVALAVADEATIKSIDKYKAALAQLADPRKITEAQAKQLIATSKPVYYITSGMHSPENGGPEMLIELPYRLAIEETPFIQAIRNNVITLITPVLEVDGREKQVDTFYYGKKTGKPRPPLMYWGKYVAHDNNRDGMAIALNLTEAVMKTFLDFRPTVLHDLHEAQSYLYTSTGTGPYNESLDAITIDEWWMLAKHETSEMAKRGVPGVFTYGFYDGWVPNYMFFIANTHNSIGRFYEVQSYGPAVNNNLRLAPTTTSREWFRPNPPLPSIKWGPRNNTNIQQSALLLALNYTARNKDVLLENFYLKGKRAIEAGKTKAPHAWIVPAKQRRYVEAAELMNMLRKHAAEIHTANASFKAGSVQVNPGDYIVRMDQPYRAAIDTLMDVQFYAPANPRPYDDTGWSLPLLRHVKAHKVDDKSILDQPMTLVASDIRIPGTITGTGNTIVVDHNGDNTLISFRFANKGVKMEAAEEDFEAGGRKFAAGSIVIRNADAAALKPSIEKYGLTAVAMASAPTVKTHDLDIPRIGYVHSWARTQDEGWVRIAFDKFGVPYTYFADQKLREGNLRAKYDVIVFPHVGGSAQSQVNGLPMLGEPVPYKKTELTPNLGAIDSTDDIRGGMGIEGLANLAKFVQEGGTLIVEGSTSVIFPEYGLTPGVTVESPQGLFVRGSVLKAVFADKKSPIAYGYDGNPMAVYFNQEPVLSAGGNPLAALGFGGGRGGQAIPGVGMNITPMATPPRLAHLEEPGATGRAAEPPPFNEQAQLMQMARQFGINLDTPMPRVIVRFPSNANDMLLSGVLVGGEALANRAAIVDAPLGKGHVVMFAARPFWRWQTHGSFNFGFNAILNWNDLDAGKTPARSTTSQ